MSLQHRYASPRREIVSDLLHISERNTRASSRTIYISDKVTCHAIPPRCSICPHLLMSFQSLQQMDLCVDATDVCSMAFAGSPSRVLAESPWTLRSSNGSISIPALVPGDAHGALEAAGIIGDVCVRTRPLCSFDHRMR